MKKTTIRTAVEFLYNFSLVYSLLLTMELIWNKEFSRDYAWVILTAVVTTLAGNWADNYMKKRKPGGA